MPRRRSSAQMHAVGTLAMVFANPMLFAIQVVQHMVHVSLTDQTTRLDRSALRIYGSNKAGQNRNGVLTAAPGWWPGGQYLDRIQPDVGARGRGLWLCPHGFVDPSTPMHRQ